MFFFIVRSIQHVNWLKEWSQVKKRAIKHKTSPARLAQLLHNFAALISILFQLAANDGVYTVQDWAVRRHWLQAKTKC